MKTIYTPIEASVTRIDKETGNIKTFFLNVSEELDFKAGQFVQMTFPGIGEAPFTPSSSPFETKGMEITIMKVGRVTDKIHELKEGDKVGLRGPFGKQYPLDLFQGKEILLVGGGVGGAPLRSLFLALCHELDRYKKVVYCYGARTPSDIIYKSLILDKWKEIGEKVKIRITVDNGDQNWKGKVGLVTTTLDDLPVDISNSVAVVCGPPIMMKFTTLKLLELGYKPAQIYLSMEKNMSCGLGKCGHCQIGSFLCCKDGPVFTYEQIKDLPAIWD